MTLTHKPAPRLDAPAYAELNAHPEVARFLTPDGRPMSPEDAWRQMAMLVGHWQLRGFGMWVVAERERPDRLIGRVGPFQPDGWPDFEIGWAIAPSFWGRGYAPEFGRALVRVRGEPAGAVHRHPLAAAPEQIGERHPEELGLEVPEADVHGRDRERGNARLPAASMLMFDRITRI